MLGRGLAQAGLDCKPSMRAGQQGREGKLIFEGAAAAWKPSQVQCQHVWDRSHHGAACWQLRLSGIVPYRALQSRPFLLAAWNERHLFTSHAICWYLFHDSHLHFHSSSGNELAMCQNSSCLDPVPCSHAVGTDVHVLRREYSSVFQLSLGEPNKLA